MAKNDKKDSSYSQSLRYLPDFAQLSNSVELNPAANMLMRNIWSRECAFHLILSRLYGLIFNQSSKAIVRLTDPISCTL